jgi:hypothetical protein
MINHSPREASARRVEAVDTWRQPRSECESSRRSSQGIPQCHAETIVTNKVTAPPSEGLVRGENSFPVKGSHISVSDSIYIGHGRVHPGSERTLIRTNKIRLQVRLEAWKAGARGPGSGLAATFGTMEADGFRSLDIGTNERGSLTIGIDATRSPGQRLARRGRYRDDSVHGGGGEAVTTPLFWRIVATALRATLRRKGVPPETWRSVVVGETDVVRPARHDRPNGDRRRAKKRACPRAATVHGQDQ